MPIGAFRLNTLAKSSAVAPLTLTFVNSSSLTSANSNNSITTPAYNTGDLIIHIDIASVGTNAGSVAPPSSVVPTGFTSFAASATPTQTGPMRLIASYQIATGNSSGTSIVGMAGTFSGTTGGTSKIVLVYRPSKAISSVTASSVTAQSNTSGLTNQTLTMTGSTLPYIGLAMYGYYSPINTRASTTTPTREVTSTLISQVYGAVKTFEAINGSTTFTTSTISMSAGSMASVRLDLT